jgi:hypothetical protein
MCFTARGDMSLLGLYPDPRASCSSWGSGDIAGNSVGNSVIAYIGRALAVFFNERMIRVIIIGTKLSSNKTCVVNRHQGGRGSSSSLHCISAGAHKSGASTKASMIVCERNLRSGQEP